MSAKESPRRLGRGLEALMGAPMLAQPAAPESARALAVSALEPGPFQPRGAMDAEALAELAASIKLRGVLQPILVRPHPTEAQRYQIIAGERRWRAAQQAGLHEMPVFLRDLSDADAMGAALVENLQRQDLNAIEEAEGYRRLIDEFALTQDQLAGAIGKSRSHVANTLRLLALPASVQAKLREGALSAGHARALLAHPDPAQAALVVLARGLNVRQTEALAQAPAPADATAKPQPDPETAALQRDLSDRLGLNVEISFNGKGGAVRIRYTTLDQLDGLIALLSRDQ